MKPEELRPDGDDPIADAVTVAHHVAVLAETDPCAPLVVALRAALDVADARRADRRGRLVAGWEVHGGDREWWARWAAQWTPYAELAALREFSDQNDAQSGRAGGAR